MHLPVSDDGDDHAVGLCGIFFQLYCSVAFGSVLFLLPAAHRLGELAGCDARSK